MRLSSNMVGDDGTGLPHNKLKIFVRLLQANHQVILSSQKLNYIKWYTCHGTLYPLLKIGLPLIKNVTKLLAKRVLIPLRLT